MRAELGIGYILGLFSPVLLDFHLNYNYSHLNSRNFVMSFHQLY
jgi:hypothetical protein